LSNLIYPRFDNFRKVVKSNLPKIWQLSKSCQIKVVKSGEASLRFDNFRKVVKSKLSNLGVTNSPYAPPPPAPP